MNNILLWVCILTLFALSACNRNHSIRGQWELVSSTFPVEMEDLENLIITETQIIGFGTTEDNKQTPGMVEDYEIKLNQIITDKEWRLTATDIRLENDGEVLVLTKSKGPKYSLVFKRV